MLIVILYKLYYTIDRDIKGGETMTTEQHVEFLINCVIEVNVEEGVEYLSNLANETSELYVISEVVSLFLFEVGDRWNKFKNFSLADAYISSKIVKLFLETIQFETTQRSKDQCAIFGNIQNDFQSSGRKLVIRFLEMAGWRIIDLGNDVAPEVFVSTAIENNVKFIGISAMLYENALHIKKVSELLDKSFSKEDRPYLIAGGATFNIVSTLAADVNVDYTASNAYEALTLFERLYKERI